MSGNALDEVKDLNRVRRGGRVPKGSPKQAEDHKNCCVF
jgi:hypothetical protein